MELINRTFLQNILPKEPNQPFKSTDSAISAKTFNIKYKFQSKEIGINFSIINKKPKNAQNNDLVIFFPGNDFLLDEASASYKHTMFQLEKLSKKGYNIIVPAWFPGSSCEMISIDNNESLDRATLISKIHNM